MNKRILAAVPMTLFFLISVAVIAWANLQRPRLMVLHSYSTDYVWTREVNVGLERALKDQLWFSIRYHYMKTKKFSSEDALRRAGIAARKAIEGFNPDVVLAIDDYAQELAAKQFINHPHINIVFAGVNGGIEPYGYDRASNVTGILERKPIAALKEVITLIARQAGADRQSQQSGPRVVALIDPSLSARRDAATLREFDWPPQIYQGDMHAEDYQQWQTAVLGAEGHVDFLLVGDYRKLPRSPTDQEYVPPKEIMDWTERNSPIPVIGMNVFNTGDGAMLSVGVSPYEQGETAGAMALAILSGSKQPNDISVQASQQYVIAMRGSAMRERGLELPQIFEAFARATNNYFE